MTGECSEFPLTALIMGKVRGFAVYNKFSHLGFPRTAVIVSKFVGFGGKEMVGVLGASMTLEILWLVFGGEVKGLSLE